MDSRKKEEKKKKKKKKKTIINTDVYVYIYILCTYDIDTYAYVCTYAVVFLPDASMFFLHWCCTQTAELGPCPLLSGSTQHCKRRDG